MPSGLSIQKTQEKSGSEPGFEEALSDFEKRMKEQDNLMYGVALFFEGISLLHAGQPALLETYRKQFRNIILLGRDTSQQAADILAQVRSDHEKLPLLAQFEFEPCRGHAQPAELAERARILVSTYERVFPDRPRSKEFAEDEALRLVDEARQAFASLHDSG